MKNDNSFAAYSERKSSSVYYTREAACSEHRRSNDGVGAARGGKGEGAQAANVARGEAERDEPAGDKNAKDRAAGDDGEGDGRGG